jgi:bromodomain-containing protein 7/9
VSPLLSGKSVKKEPGHEDGVSQQHFEEAAKLLQEFQEGQVERGGSRPSSNLSSLSGTSDRDQHHLGEDCRTTLSGAHPLTWLYQFLSPK